MNLQEGENNFHAFYQLLKGAPKNQLDKLHLKNELSQYRYLGGGSRGGKAQLPQKVWSNKHTINLSYNILLF